MYLPTRKIRIVRRRVERGIPFIVRVMFFFVVIYLVAGYVCNRYTISFQSPVIIKEVELVSPLPKEAGESGKLKPKEEPTPTATPGAHLQIVRTAYAEETVFKLQGEASYYSRAGCLGCSATMTMANGETLDDGKLTLALTPEIVGQYKLLNDIVKVTNVRTGESVEAKVTDTGGFGKYNRIADLSIATRDAINCSNLCEVVITY